MSSINGRPVTPSSKRSVTPVPKSTSTDDSQRSALIDSFLRLKGYGKDTPGRVHVFRGFPTDRAKSASDRVDHC